MNILLLALKISVDGIASARNEATQEAIDVNLEKLARNSLGDFQERPYPGETHLNGIDKLPVM